MATKILFNVYDLERGEPIPSSELPADFPMFTVTGESPYEGDFFVTPHTTNTHTNNYIFTINNKGEVMNYKKVENQAYDFKKVRSSEGKVRYTYLDIISKEVPTVGGVGFYENSELVILDAKLNEIDRKRFEENQEIPEDYPVENHFSLYKDDGNYIVAAYFQPEGSVKYENAIQEIKWGRDIWHWETNDAPELAALSHTSSTGDYAHINAMSIDYDGNYIISFRNIGLVKLNKETKEIMWVIGKNRNDFTGLDTQYIPFQQHDVRVYKYDGSISVFDNYGHTTNSRVLRYWLNEDTMTCEKVEEYLTTKTRSNYMGSAQLIDGAKNIYDITYGSGWNFGFEEYDFSTNTQLMQFTFNDGHDLYNIVRDVDNLASSFSGGNTPPEPPIVLPEPIYKLEGEVFDGTRHIDSGIKLFETSKTFSIVTKITFDKDYLATAPNQTYEVIFHNMYEASPWNGITSNLVRGATTVSQSVDLNLTASDRFTVIPTSTTIANIPDELVIVFTYDATNNVATGGSFLSDGSIYSGMTTENTTFKTDGLYRNQNLIIGAADMLGIMDRHFIGTMHNFNLYDVVLSEEEIVSIIKDINK